MQQSSAPTRVREVFRVAERNARKRSIEWSLTQEDLDGLWERSNGQCQISGIPFDLGPPTSHGRRRPFAPSLDRINSAKSYSRRNVRLVSVLLNLAMNEWGLEPVVEVAVAIAAAQFTEDQVLDAALRRIDRKPAPIPSGWHIARDFFQISGSDLSEMTRRLTAACRASGIQPRFIDVQRGTWRRREKAYPLQLLEYVAEHSAASASEAA